MMEGEGIVNGKVKEPICKIVAEWLVDVYINIPEEIGKNAWKQMDFELLTNLFNLSLIQFVSTISVSTISACV